jgi:hypothetical protein
LEEFAKVVYSFLFDPISFSGSTSYLFDDSGGYPKVFGKLRSGIWWLAAEFSPALKEYKSTLQDKVSIAALERKWFVIYTARLVLQQAKGEDDYKKTLIANWNGNWKLGEGDVGQFFERLFKVSLQAVIYVYKQAAKRGDFIHRNWMRNNETSTELKEYVFSNPLLRI